MQVQTEAGRVPQARQAAGSSGAPLSYFNKLVLNTASKHAGRLAQAGRRCGGTDYICLTNAWLLSI